MNAHCYMGDRDMKKARMRKTSDLDGITAAVVLSLYNPDKILIMPISAFTPDIGIFTDTPPIELVYPEGWYYAKGTFRNKHTSSNGRYSEIRMFHRNGREWDETYCTLPDDYPRNY